jgi:hypothetical protein
MNRIAAEAVTEGDTGYEYSDYEDAYDDRDFLEASGDVHGKPDDDDTNLDG